MARNGVFIDAVELRTFNSSQAMPCFIALSRPIPFRNLEGLSTSRLLAGRSLAVGPEPSLTCSHTDARCQRSKTPSAYQMSNILC